MLAATPAISMALSAIAFRYYCRRRHAIFHIATRHAAADATLFMPLIRFHALMILPIYYAIAADAIFVTDATLSFSR